MSSIVIITPSTMQHTVKATIGSMKFDLLSIIGNISSTVLLMPCGCHHATTGPTSFFCFSAMVSSGYSPTGCHGIHILRRDALCAGQKYALTIPRNLNFVKTKPPRRAVFTTNTYKPDFVIASFRASDEYLSWRPVARARSLRVLHLHQVGFATCIARAMHKRCSIRITRPFRGLTIE